MERLGYCQDTDRPSWAFSRMGTTLLPNFLLPPMHCLAGLIAIPISLIGVGGEWMQSNSYILFLLID